MEIAVSTIWSNPKTTSSAVDFVLTFFPAIQQIAAPINHGMEIMAGGTFSPRRRVWIKLHASNTMAGPRVNKANQFQTLSSMSINLFETTSR
jgi:hypothetical protein